MRPFYVLDSVGVGQMVNRANLRHATLILGGASADQCDQAAARVKELEDIWAVLSGFRPRSQSLFVNN